MPYSGKVWAEAYLLAVAATVGLNFVTLVLGSDRFHSPVCFDHLLGMLPRSLRQFRARQHAGHFFGPFFPGYLPDGGFGSSTGSSLFDQIMLIGEGCDLRKVGHAQDLICFGQCFQLFPHCLGCAASDAGIDFVEDERALCGGILLPAAEFAA